MKPFEKYALEPGREDLAKLLGDWEKIAQACAGGLNVILPNYYLSITPGFDLEEALISMSEYLERRHLMEFAGPAMYYQFFLNYSRPEDNDFPAFRDLFNTVNDELSEYSKPFGGILAVDITEWVEKDACASKKFREFMAYMADLDRQTVAIFVDSSGKLPLTLKAQKLLGTKTRLECLKVALNDPKGALVYLEEDLGELGLHLSPEAEAWLLPTLGAVLKTPGSEGRATLEQLAEDIAYSIARTGKAPKGDVKQSDIASFGPEGNWIKTFKESKSRDNGLFGE
jgi:hypothetical protein